MTKIDPSLYLQNQTKRTTNTNLGKEEFLKILMAQLQHQDPLNPMKDKEFVSQMTNFSSLEQMMNMSSSINGLVNHLNVSPVIQYSNFIDKKISYTKFDEETGESLGESSGVVVAVGQTSGEAVLELENGDNINANQIVKISKSTVE